MVSVDPLDEGEQAGRGTIPPCSADPASTGVVGRARNELAPGIAVVRSDHRHSLDELDARGAAAVGALNAASARLVAV
jgi:hypothetical protein